MDRDLLGRGFGFSDIANGLDDREEPTGLAGFSVKSRFTHFRPHTNN